MPPPRPVQAERIRIDAARFARWRPHPAHRSNGDEDCYRTNRIGNYSKGLPHNQLGEVDAQAYDTLLNAVRSGNSGDFENIQLTPAEDCSPKGRRRLTNPQAGLCFDLEGPDAQALTMPPAPPFDSAQEAGEMAELYWMAVLRDIPFEDYDNNGEVADAVADLTDNFSDFRGPKRDGRVTSSTLFRGFTPGDLVGPYVSQFLLKDFNYGTLRVSHKQQTAKPGVDYLTDYDEWLEVQNGCDRGLSRKEQHERDGDGEFVYRYIRNARDLASYVHFDAPYEPYLNACFVLLDMKVDMKAPFDPGNPYKRSSNQAGFGTFGDPHVLCLVAEVVARALKAVWYQKWFVHRRLRPEEFGGRIHNHKTEAASYPINAEILDSPVLQKVFDRYGTYLLPQAFPEGSPTHPAYGAGHATIAGACVTVLKAWFDEAFKIEAPVIANADGTELKPYTGIDKGNITVGGELNKLAANISIGRNMGGVHWRSDYTGSAKLGEDVAIQLLEEQREIYNEDYSFTLTRFDGTPITIAKP